ncbi:MAG: TDT family transporter [Fusobacteriaceae bacterium]|nr:TDT family transporter [Fusobacteriaceae bacterium]MBP9509952.1 TDT family transporter [Fusobacteriaceae bacterium]
MNLTNEKVLQKIETLPVGLIATSLGAATLSNAYMNLDFTLLRPFFMVFGMLIILGATLKIAFYRDVFKNEYKNTVPASVYGTYSLLITVIGSFISQYYFTFGKIVWCLGIIIHIVFTLFFTYIHLFKNFNKNSFVPSWFIIYNGIMVSVVVGGKMNEPLLLKAITYYGITTFFIILPFMVKRVIKNPLPIQLIHTKAIFMAPVSLSFISYLTVTETINVNFVFFIYTLLIISLVYILINMKKFFSVEFNPGFGALTFPLAIGTVASFKMSNFLDKFNYLELSNWVFNLAVTQLCLATAVIGFILYNFLTKKNSK